MAWAFAVGIGRDFLHWKSKRKARVLYIDGEMPRDLLQERIELACEWFDIDPPEARNVSLFSSEDFENMPPLDTEDGQIWLNNFIDGHGPFDFIIFDNIMSLCSAIMKEEESWQALPYALSLSRRKIGQMWLHHTGHDKSRAYGTKTREWQMDTVMVAEEVAKDHIGFNLRFTKTRRRKPSNAEDFKEVYIELRDGAWIHREPEEAATGRPNKSEEIAMKALRQANLEVDGDVPESAWRKCAYELGISDSENEDSRRAAFRRASKALVAAGKVIKRDNKYTIAD